MKVLVTGSEGFIGKNLCNFLKAKGVEVEGYDIKLSQRLPSINGIDAIIHLGANSNTTEKDLDKILKENFEASCVFYQLCEANNIKFQYSSSASVYGNGTVFKEDAFCSPLNPYGLSKYFFDCWLLNKKYPAQGFRYFNVYGKHEDHKGSQASPIHKFTKQAKEDGIITLFAGSEKMVRDFVHVDDVCEAHYRMLFSDKSGVFNVGTGESVSFENLAIQIADKYSSHIKYIEMPEELRSHYQYFTKADNQKLIDAVGEISWKSVLDHIKEEN